VGVSRFRTVKTDIARLRLCWRSINRAGSGGVFRLAARVLQDNISTGLAAVASGT
jgi:hypothetical protein